MQDAEMLKYLTEIIRRAQSPEIAAEAILGSGLCHLTDIDEALSRVWENAGPRNWDASRNAVTVKWRPDGVYVRCYKYDAAAKTLPQALQIISDKVAAWYESFDPEFQSHHGWNQL